VLGASGDFDTVEGNLRMNCVAHLNSEHRPDPFESWPSALRQILQEVVNVVIAIFQHRYS
jgi:hypothetical protein